MSETLKPCPKCGSTDVVAGFHGDEDGGYGYAECRHAEMSDGHFCGVHADDEEEAIRIWNTRPTPGEDKPLGIEEVVERVARAIAPRIFYEFDCNTMERAAKWEVHGENDRETMRLIAKDAIEAYEQARASTPPRVDYAKVKEAWERI